MTEPAVKETAMVDVGELPFHHEPWCNDIHGYDVPCDAGPYGDGVGTCDDCLEWRSVGAALAKLDKET